MDHSYSVPSRRWTTGTVYRPGDGPKLQCTVSHSRPSQEYNSQAARCFARLRLRRPVSCSSHWPVTDETHETSRLPPQLDHRKGDRGRHSVWVDLQIVHLTYTRTLISIHDQLNDLWITLYYFVPKVTLDREPRKLFSILSVVWSWSRTGFLMLEELAQGTWTFEVVRRIMWSHSLKIISLCGCWAASF